MLQRNSRTVIHPTLGTITLKPKFAQVLELPFFREMLFKNQLGSLFQITIGSCILLVLCI